MKIQISKEGVDAATTGVSGFMMEDKVTPIFGYTEILANPKNQTVSVSVQHAMAGIRLRVPAKVEGVSENTRIMLRHKHAKMIMGLGLGDLTITHPKEDGKINPRIYRCYSGKNVKIDLPVLNAEDSLPFLSPPGKDIAGFPVDRDAWLAASRRLASMVRHNDVDRYALGAVHCMPTMSQASNGNRLLRTGIVLGPQEMLIPAPVFPLVSDLLARSQGAVVSKLTEDQKYIWFLSQDGWGAFFRLVDVKYPDTSGFVVTENSEGRIKLPVGGEIQTWKMDVGKDALLDALNVIKKAFDASDRVSSDLPVVAFKATDYGLFLRLRQGSLSNDVDIRVTEGNVEAPRDARMALEMVNLNGDDLRRLIEAGFDSQDKVTIRWAHKQDFPVQITSGDGSLAVTSQVRL